MTKIYQFLGLMNRPKPEKDIYLKNPYFTDGTMIEKIQLCIIFEMLLRHYNQSGNSKWFFSPEEANEMDVLHLVVSHRLINGQYVFELR
jgi:hypothetical protein